MFDCAEKKKTNLHLVGSSNALRRSPQKKGEKLKVMDRVTLGCTNRNSLGVKDGGNQKKRKKKKQLGKKGLEVTTMVTT